ncbi:related to cytochrome P450 CYP4/CYP19/CYP26 subfamilies [Rhynchosporium agropyri]|uniref:Related to cytochrome P450 CYP4/CYP19/CYP26 subfamilies n=1 Tax=Rhynchosporium agropyri TaxID=914238 RepID=A0A1E1LNY6_9HELO|nr:related to cytochrome P450 CYP4/CYP19/CYP26 subfamilies [Rhynchosporium agropyri]
MVSFSNPELIPTVYPTREGFPKSDFYATLRPYTRGGGALQAVFNITDEKLHKKLKSPIAPIFSSASATSFEHLVDDTLQCLLKQLDTRFAVNREVLDLGKWVQFFAFDVMGTMTFSKRYGFLDNGRDTGGMLGSIVAFMRNAAPFTQVPRLDWIMRKNLIADAILQFFNQRASLSILGFVGGAIKEKREELAKGAAKVGDEASTRKDFLSRYIELQENNPEIPPWAPTAWTFSNVIAGSDSVGSLMRTIMFCLLSYPNTLDRLYNELLSANLSRPFPGYKEVRNLPYLDACVQEGARIHPPFALPFERVVPEGGVTILGHFLPAGTVIGGSPYVVNRHKPFFGEDAEFWRPERWLERDDAHKRKLEQGVLTYGAGRRVCLGKHIGILEIKKLISFLVLNYDIRIVDREKFEVENSWFLFQTGLYAQIQKRSDPVVIIQS